MLSTGDQVSVTIRDEQLGDHSYTATVPASLTEFTLTPPLVAGKRATAESYSLSWNAVDGATSYSIGMGQYYESGSSSGSSTTFQETSKTIDNKHWLYEDFFGKDWIYFEVDVVTATALTGFRNDSSIEIVQPASTKKNNFVSSY